MQKPKIECLSFSTKMTIICLMFLVKLSCGDHRKLLPETFQMSTNNICFYREIIKQQYCYPTSNVSVEK